MILGYEYGLDRIYDRAFIEKKKLEPDFPREYGLMYMGRVGNLLSPLVIDKAIAMGEQLKDIPVSQYTVKHVGVDSGFGSSNTAIVVTEDLLKDKGKIRVICAEEFGNHNPSDICSLLFDLYRKWTNCYFWIDGANRGFVTQLKIAFGESTNYENRNLTISPNTMLVLPVNFATSHKEMVSHLHMLMTKGYIAIPKKYDKLLTSLRTAIVNELSLDKQETSYSDSFDSFRLALKGYKFN